MNFDDYPKAEDRWTLGERSGWSLSGRQIEVVGVSAGFSILIRVGPWSAEEGARARAADALCLTLAEWQALVAGGTKDAPEGVL